MVPSALEKAEHDRSVLEAVIEVLVLAVDGHAHSPLTQPAVERMLKDVSDHTTELRDIHKRILSTKPPDTLPHATNFRAISSELIRLEGKLNTIRASFRRSTPPRATHSTSIPPATQDIRLPRLELPQFNGDPTAWTSFRDLFTAAVDKKTSLSKVEKLTYLKSLLTSEAARQIENFTLSESNYDLAWQCLVDRYENEREQIFAILRKLMQQPQEINSAQSVRGLLDNCRGCIRSFSSYGGTLEHILVYIIFTKMGSNTKEIWFQTNNAAKIPTLSDVYLFLERRAMGLSAGLSSTTTPPPRRPRSESNIHNHHTQVTPKQPSCILSCSSPHRPYKCPEFLKLSTTDKFEKVKTNNLCYNCLIDGHTISTCRSTNLCKVCGKKHHTLLHIQSARNDQNENEGNLERTPTPSEPLSHHGHQSGEIPPALLATAVIQVQGKFGPRLCRALLDNGASNSFVTESCARKLGLEITKTSTAIKGLSSSSVGMSLGTTNFIMSPHFATKERSAVQALVIPTITSKLPNTNLHTSSWEHIKDLQLADPEFNITSHIDVLLGSDIFWEILSNETKRGQPSQPIAVKTKLGWLVAGQTSPPSIPRVNCFLTNQQLDENLERFWNSDGISSTATDLTQEELACENHFISNTKRDDNGRFVVGIPWKQHLRTLGESRQHAITRLKSMERRLGADKFKHYREEYVSFMREYESLDHMARVPESEVLQPQHTTYYIPHHFVLKADSSTTKFRVVFDASAKSTNGVSLNDSMMVGATVQSSLFEILLRFRCHNVAFTADITKMYRQIRLTETDQDSHRILWREDPTHSIKEYKLKTVTYGTASAPFLATRALQKLAEEECQRLPIAAAIMRRDFYVDDLLSGKESKSIATQAIAELITLTSSAGMELRKWTCNDEEVLNSIPMVLRETKDLIPLEEQSVKTLGIHWNPRHDEYIFKINLPTNIEDYSKRAILSEIAQLFDPIGWLAPVTVKAKILMQDLWKLNCEWDTVLPTTIQKEWRHYKSSLKYLEQIRIPRLVIKRRPFIHLIGFSDASLKAYAAVVYLYTEDEFKNVSVALLTSKTRVAPIRATTLPRLELQAAVLLSELLDTVNTALMITFNSIRAYTDSTITLAWIRSDPNRWKTYVRNRIIRIQSCIPSTQWYHVSGERNPADCASRGLVAEDLLKHDIWWNGNLDIFHNTDEPSVSDTSSLQIEEQSANAVCHLVTGDSTSVLEFIERFSSLRRMKHVMAYILRMQRRFKHQNTEVNPASGPLSSEELDFALMEVVKYVQFTSFSQEIKLLQKGSELPTNSKLLPLTPFIHSDGILRVGGRLRHARIRIDQKHPILLPRHHPLTKLIINDIHERNFHAGAQATLAILNQRFWIVRGRDAVRLHIKKCVRCVRQQGVTFNQIMGDLPEARVNAARPFQKCGVDCAGPFAMKNYGRSNVTLKAYLVLFVCFVTRAMHLEVSSSLSTDSFMAAFRRFISRRGKPSDVYSDCGTNFVGARRILGEMIPHTTHEDAQSRCADEGITWHFNPPGAPHFGGLWEAGVKSVKFHLRRVMGNQALTYEELSTLITQIEGILNSWPLTPISTDPNDLEVLTPGHFLIGCPITALPDPDYTDITSGRLDRWKLLQQKQQGFWKRWYKEFITRMQHRPKWMKTVPAIKLNDIVIIKEENLAPTQWKLGRVIQLHPGDDGNVRVVTMRTQTGITKRVINKLCLLPVNYEYNSVESGLQ